MSASVYKILFIAFFLLISFCQGVKAQPVIDYSVHANIIYHFTKYVDWPEHKKNGDFVIGVIGESAIGKELAKITANKSAGGQRIVVKQVSAADAFYNCHILLISNESSGDVKKIAAKTNSLPVLVVAEQEGLASRGACISFGVNSERLKLEINKKNIENRHLRVATELLNLAKLVK